MRTFSVDALRDLYEVRIALETHAARLICAIPHGRSPGLAQLRVLLDQAGQVVDSVQSYPEELDFHHRLVASAGNAPLLDATVEVHRQIQVARTRSGHVATRAERAHDEHRRIVEQLERGDGQQAATLLEEHLRASLGSALRVLGADGVVPGRTPTVN